MAAPHGMGVDRRDVAGRVGAVYGGFHYAVDIMAGAAFGGSCAVLVLR